MSDKFSGVTELIGALVSAGTGDTAYQYKALLLDKLDGIEAAHRELTTRAEAAERELAELRERTRWRKYPDEKPVNDDTLPKDYCFHRWTGNEYEVYACAYWCKYEFDDREIYGEVTYNFWLGKFELYVNLEPINIVVLEWTTLPVPPEAENA